MEKTQRKSRTMLGLWARVMAVGMIVVCLMGCKAGKPRGILSEGKMETLLYKYELARALAANQDSSEIRGRAYVLSVLREEGVTQAQFDSSLVWYYQHMEVLQKVYERVGKRLNNELSLMGAATNEVTRYSNLSSEGDTANIWPGRAYYLLSNNGFDNRFSFDIPADTAFLPSDIFKLNFHAEFLQRMGSRHAVAMLAVQYNNDSIGRTEYHVYGSGDQSITLTTAARPIKRIYGFVYMLSGWDETPRLMFVFSPSLVRIHKPKPKPEPASDKPDSLRATSDSTANQSNAATSGHASQTDTAKPRVQPSLPASALHSRPKARSISHPAQHK